MLFKSKGTSFRSLRDIYSTDRSMTIIPPLPPLSLSHQYPADLIPLVQVTILTTLPRLIHYSAWPTANNFRYIRFSRGHSIARRLSLLRGCDATLAASSMVQWECFDSFHARITGNEITRKNEQCGSLELFTREHTSYFATIIRKVNLKNFSPRISRFWSAIRTSLIRNKNVEN